MIAMNEMNVLRSIRLKDLWDLFVHRIVVIALAAVITAGSLFVYDRISYTPQYTSTATLYIKQQAEGNLTVMDAYNEFSLALRLVKDCDYLLKSRTVLQGVIDELDLDISYSQLHARVSTTNPTNTRVLEVTAIGDTPQQAKAIVDKICDIASVKMEEAMGLKQVNLYEYGTTPTHPSNRMNMLIYVLAGGAAAMLTFAVFMLMFLLDDRIRNDEDMERLLGLTILAEIPDLNDTSKDRYGYYRGYGQNRTGKKKPRKSPHAKKKES
jgi:capsular polysaccharide biosynthesis protein